MVHPDRYSDGADVVPAHPFEFKKDNDFDTDNAKAKGYERYTPGFADLRAIVGSPGA